MVDRGTNIGEMYEQTKKRRMDEKDIGDYML